MPMRDELLIVFWRNQAMLLSSSTNFNALRTADFRIYTQLGEQPVNFDNFLTPSLPILITRLALTAA
jgi:hypothetical protein